VKTVHIYVAVSGQLYGAFSWPECLHMMHSVARFFCNSGMFGVTTLRLRTKATLYICDTFVRWCQIPLIFGRNILERICSKTPIYSPPNVVSYVGSFESL